MPIIGIEKFDNTNVLIGAHDKLQNDITWKNVVILIACVIKDDNKLYPQLFLQKKNFFLNKYAIQQDGGRMPEDERKGIEPVFTYKN